jgi:hypothetical protein
MSALGQKQAFCFAETMSALPLKAGMCAATRDEWLNAMSAQLA